MKVLEFPLARITIWFVCGLLTASYFHVGLVTAAVFLVISLLVFCFSFYFSNKNSVPRSYFGMAAGLMSFCIGATVLTIHSGYNQKDNYVHKADGNPHHITIVLREKLKSSAYKDRYVALVKTFDGEKSSGKILVNFEKGKLANHLKVGANIKVTAEVILHKKPYNPDQFDYGKYLDNKSIHAQIYADARNVKIGKQLTKDIFYYSDALRNRMLKNLEKSISAKELAVIAALILGQQQDISSDIIQDYQFAGAVHILSVSGLHVGFILIFINFLLNFLPKNKNTSYLKLTITLLSLWGFAVLAGLAPSVIRSVTMFSFVAVGLHLRRKTNIFHTLLVSILLILLVEPSFIFDVGFQLSYVALFFILWLQPILSNLWQPQNRIVKYFWDILTVSFAAQIGAFPLSVYYFHQFPGLFFATNLVIIPFLSVIMAVGVVVMILAAFNYVPEMLAKILEWSILILNKIIRFIASFDTFIIQDIPFNKGMLLTLYLFIIALVVLSVKPNFKRWAFALSSLFVFQLAFFGTNWRQQHQKEWIVFNSKKSTLITERRGEKITVFTNDSLKDNKTLKAYAVANFSKVTNHKALQNLAYFNDKKILIIDSLGQYPEKIAPDLIVLRQSPKINLERLLQHCKPKMIVADASNYKTYAALWKSTCLKQKIPFHAVAEKGFYKLD